MGRSRSGQCGRGHKQQPHWTRCNTCHGLRQQWKRGSGPPLPAIALPELCANGLHPHTPENRASYGCRLCKNLAVHRNQRRRRARIMSALGDHCACCGETEPTFLTIEHIGGTGAIARNSAGSYGKMISALIRRLDAGDTLDELEALCWNCNSGRALNGGICPHLTRENGIAYPAD